MGLASWNLLCRLLRWLEGRQQRPLDPAVAAAAADQRLLVRPLRWFLIFFALYPILIVAKFYRRIEHVPPGTAAWYLIFVGFFALVWKLAQDPAAQRLCWEMLAPREKESERPADRWSWGWLAAGLGVVLFNLALLEGRHGGYTFTQDDTLSQFLPVILHGCRSAWEGVLPVWNPHQFAGAPTLTLGTYALTYPGTYLSYAIARHGLGNEFATLEVFAWLHLVAGYFTTLALARQLRLSMPLAVAGAVAFVLSGYFLVAGRSWFYMFPLAAWMPLAMLLLERWRARPVGWGWMLSLGAVLGLLFHAGNVQMWVYLLMFAALYAGWTWGTGRATRGQVLQVAAALALGIGLAAPLLILQAAETSTTHRYTNLASIFGSLPAVLVPWPLSSASLPGFAGTDDLRYMAQFYYSGTLFAALALLAGGSLILHRWPRPLLAGNVYVALAALAFIEACGIFGVVWYVQHRLPVFDKLTVAFKFLPYFNLFAVLAGGVLLERLQARRNWSPRVVPALAAAVLGLMTYHSVLATSSFFTWGFRPYPELPADVQQLLAARPGKPPNRIFPLAPKRGNGPDYYLSEMHNLPTLHGHYSLLGYDPLVSENAAHRLLIARLRGDDPLSVLRAYGVRWVLAYDVQDLPPLPPGQRPFHWYEWTDYDRRIHDQLQREGKLAHSADGFRIYELEAPAPLAFAAAPPCDPIDVRFSAAGARLTLPAGWAGGDVKLNVLPPRFLHASVGGRAQPFQLDACGRLVIAAPAGTTSIEFHYSPPWFAALSLGLAVCLAAAAAFSAALRWAPSTRRAAGYPLEIPAEPAPAPRSLVHQPGKRCSNKNALAGGGSARSPERRCSPPIAA